MEFVHSNSLITQRRQTEYVYREARRLSNRIVCRRRNKRRDSHRKKYLRMLNRR